MFDIYLRNLKDAIVEPITKLFKNLKKHGITPNTFTLLSGVFGLLGVWNSYRGNIHRAIAYFMLNRLFDGIDGAYARMTDQCSEFGGYLDIIVDFTIYGLVPLGITANKPTNEAWIALALLEVSFFVNAAGLFMLSNLIVTNEKAKKRYLKQQKEAGKLNKEVTTVNMPPGLIEGFESMVLFSLMIILPEK